MEQFITIIAQNAGIATAIAVGWAAFSTGFALVVGRAIRYGME